MKIRQKLPFSSKMTNLTNFDDFWAKNDWFLVRNRRIWPRWGQIRTQDPTDLTDPWLVSSPWSVRPLEDPSGGPRGVFRVRFGGPKTPKNGHFWGPKTPILAIFTCPPDVNFWPLFRFWRKCQSWPQFPSPVYGIPVRDLRSRSGIS